MGLNIKNAEVEQLASEVASLARETKTEAIRQALLERRERLKARGQGASGRENLKEYLEKHVWPLIPKREKGRVLTSAEEDEILGYGPDGV